MSIYDVDYSIIFKQILPVDKRVEPNLSWGTSLVKPLQWNHDNFFSEYLDGSSALEYDAGTSYALFQEVRYNNRIYQCIKESTGNAPTNTAYWIEVNKDFRGARQRIKYNGQKLVLEYILNKWFGTTFISKPIDESVNSEFYIRNTNENSNNFFVGETSPNTSYVASYSGIQEYFVPEESGISTTNFKVYYPVTVIPLEESDPKYKQMVAIVDKFKLYGTTVGYQSY
jgi:hypothetical protein